MRLIALLFLALVAVGCDDKSSTNNPIEKAFEWPEYRDRHKIKRVLWRDADGIHVDQLPLVRPEECMERQRSKCPPLSGVYFPATARGIGADEFQQAYEEMER